MKRLLLITSSLFALFAANAQATFQVGSGVKITTSGTPNIVYTGGSVVNNGSLAMSSGTLKTTGATTFSGTGTASLNDVSFFTGSELQQQLSVTGTATVNGTLSAGNELLYIRGDQSAAAKLVNNGVLTGSVKGLNTNATVTSGAPGFSSSLSTNIAGTNTRYQWQESADGNSWTDIFGQTAAAYQAVVNSTRSYRALISASNSAFTGVTSPVKLSAVAESDYFITEWTFLATPSTLTIGYLFTGDSVSYSFTTNKGKSGSGRVHRPTGGSQILQLGSAMEVGEVLTLKISPDSLKAITFSGTHRTYLTNVKQWGSVKWTSMTSMFSGCNNLQITAADIPDLTLINSLQSTFQDCWKLDGPANIGSWNTSTITNLFRTFFNARIFNQNINNWDVSKVSNMQSLFNNAYKYNQPLDKWDVRKVTNFSYLFCGAELFNQDIGQWKTELGTNMEGMFYSAFAFNKDISTWPVDSVVNLIGFLRNTKSFDQDISPLAAKLKSVVILDNFMMDTCKLSTANYDAWLIGLAATGFTGKTITSRFQTYCGAKAERDTLTLKRSWLVSDAGMSAGPCVNAAPDISGLPASPTTCDDRTYTTAFTVSDERLNSVVLSAFSSNTTLLPNANLALTNTGTATPSITVTPVSGQAGLAAIGIVATDHLGQKDTAYLYLGIGNPVQTLSVYAGSTSGTANGTLAEAKFSRPYGMARDSKGNIFVTDEVSHCIRKITPEGVVSTFAGSAGVSGYVEGIGTAARFFYPREVIVDKNDNLYITDTENHRVRKITPDGTTSLVAGTGTPSSTNGNALGQASFSSPMGIVIDAQGDLFIGDYNGRRIRKINMTTAQVSTVAGSGANGSQDGTALQASFSSPAGLVFDQSGNLLIADYFNSKVRKLDQSNVVTTIIGNGQNTSTEGSGTQAAIGWVDFLSVDPGNGDVYMGLDACKIRKFNTAGQITTVIDNGCALVLGPLATASTGGAKKFLFLPGGDILLTSGTRILKIGTTYEPCNAKPAFSPASLANDTLCLVSSNTNLTSRTLTVSDADGTIASTVVSSSNPSLVSAINTGSATNVVIALNQKANESGSAVIKVVSTDNLGAKDSVSFTIVVNKVVALSFNINVTCNGAQNGSAGVSVSGGTAPYTYSWTVFTDSTRSLITKIPSGTYTVTVKDKFNCQASKSITVTQPAALVVVKDSSLISCYGLEDGRAKVSPSGGSTPYEYAWSNGKTSKEITGLAAGTYSVTVTDVNSCQRLISFNITQPADITNPTIADGGEVCAGQTVTFTSGSNATSFQWEKSSSSLSADFTPLSDGTFFTGSGTKSLTITSSELTADARYRVKQIQSATCFKYSPGIGFSAKDCNALPQFASTALYNDTLCYDTLNHTLGSRAINVSDSDGSIVSTEVKSSNPNLVSVSNSGTNTAVNLVLTQKANQYGSAVITVISTDDLGAKDSVSFRIRVNKLLGSVFSTGLKCFGDSTILTASGSDGVAPYSYVWTGVTSSVDTTPKVGPGSYSVLITDKFGCKATVKPTVTSPPQIVFVKDSSNISCFGANDGKASVTVSGGAGDKELLWSPSGATTNQILNQAPGIKTVTATDGFGCTASTTFNITEPAQIINPPISNQSDICQGSTVNFTTTASNVNSYQWEKSPDGNTNANYTALADTGAYSGTATNKISIVSGPGSANALYRVKLIQSANCFTYSTPVMFTNKVCNVAPVLSGIQNQLICQNDTLTDLPFTVTDENPSGITYTVTSSNSVVVPASVIQITGSGSDRKVHFNAALTTPGTAIIKITGPIVRYNDLFA
ncbi:MAG: BspA family leucine-rich repeat surface protein, partial [Bacteroidota bacterium]